MRKIINSATTQYEPLLTEELVLDDRPISGSFNGITSDAVYKAISVDPGNVPPVESTDNGKVLTASYGEGGGSFAWATPEAPQSELPAYTTSDADKVLGVVVDSSGDTPVASLDWVDQPANELPAQLGTAGQVLTVNAGATGVEWATPSGGGGGGSVSMTPVIQAERLTINFGSSQGTIQTWATPSGSSFSGTLSKNDVLFLDLFISADNGGGTMEPTDKFGATVYCSDNETGEHQSPIASIASSPFIPYGEATKCGMVRVPLRLLRNLSVSSDSTTRDWTLKIDLTVPPQVTEICDAYISKL